MKLELKIDSQEIPLNDFVEKILIGTIVGATTSLKGIKENWKNIDIKISN